MHLLFRQNGVLDARLGQHLERHQLVDLRVDRRADRIVVVALGHLRVPGRAPRLRQPVDDLLKRGAKEAKSPKEIGQASSIVFLCVTGSKQVEAVVRGPDGLAAGLKAGSIIVDCSTSDPTSTMALAAELAAHNITLVDAPLSRTPKEAWEGQLDTMVGCTDAVFARLKPVLETWAGRVIHIGGTGDGHRMKLLNNFVSMGYASLYAEALTLAQKVGITPQRFDSVVRGGRMDCGFYQTFMKYVLERDRDAHKFTLQNALKDMTYLESMANDAGDDFLIAASLAETLRNHLHLPAVALGVARVAAEEVARKQRGFFAAEGIEFDLLWTDGGSDILQAVISGSADVGIGTGISLLAYRRSNRIVGVDAARREVRLTRVDGPGAGFSIPSEGQAILVVRSRRGGPVDTAVRVSIGEILDDGTIVASFGPGAAEVVAEGPAILGRPLSGDIGRGGLPSASASTFVASNSEGLKLCRNERIRSAALLQPARGARALRISFAGSNR